MIYKITIKDMILIGIGTLVLTSIIPNLETKKTKPKIETKTTSNNSSNSLYCLESKVTDNPYDKQLKIFVLETTTVNDEEYIQYTFSEYNKGDIISNNNRSWFDDWNVVSCSTSIASTNKGES